MNIIFIIVLIFSCPRTQSTSDDEFESENQSNKALREYNELLIQEDPIDSNELREKLRSIEFGLSSERQEINEVKSLLMLLNKNIELKCSVDKLSKILDIFMKVKSKPGFSLYLEENLGPFVTNCINFMVMKIKSVEEMRYLEFHEIDVIKNSFIENLISSGVISKKAESLNFDDIYDIDMGSLEVPIHFLLTEERLLDALALYLIKRFNLNSNHSSTSINEYVKSYIQYIIERLIFSKEYLRQKFETLPILEKLDIVSMSKLSIETQNQILEMKIISFLSLVHVEDVQLMIELAMNELEHRSQNIVDFIHYSGISIEKLYQEYETLCRIENPDVDWRYVFILVRSLISANNSSISKPIMETSDIQSLYSLAKPSLRNMTLEDLNSLKDLIDRHSNHISFRAYVNHFKEYHLDTYLHIITSKAMVVRDTLSYESIEIDEIRDICSRIIERDESSEVISKVATYRLLNRHQTLESVARYLIDNKGTSEFQLLLDRIRSSCSQELDWYRNYFDLMPKLEELGSDSIIIRDPNRRDILLMIRMISFLVDPISEQEIIDIIAECTNHPL